MEKWYQFIYHNGRDVVCGVRLYKSEQDFYNTHFAVIILKTIEHELPTKKDS